MAIIPQKSLFEWDEIEKLEDLERLKLVLESMPDEELMRELEKERGHGRNDYPVRAMWNSILAGVIFEHSTIESLRRELSRNGQLRFLCGFRAVKRIPPADVYTRFFKKLMEKMDRVEDIFNNLVKELKNLLEGFGKNLAIDGKAIHSLARGCNKNEQEDGRRDLDANWGAKKYKGTHKDGTSWSTIKSWFGYKLHLIVDTDYEIPVAFDLTKASTSEVKQAHKMVDKLNEDQEEIVEECQTLSADRGYDDQKLHIKLWDEYEIKGVIDITNNWADPEETRQLAGYENAVYDNKGTIYCYCMETGTKRQMCPGGFEKDRKQCGTLKKLCPAQQYDIDCKYIAECSLKKGIRIDIAKDRRRFTPIDRSSHQWDRIYNKRPAVERINSRIDESYGFENHHIRGEKKMKTRCGISLCVMLAMAVGRIKAKQPEKMRSLVKSA